ncbi:winged helix-turn-helix domain-containing protein [Candidiatus Paracoxiella cheracis]|uniref:winged helix-turn-helix domain-containing protein n=1 Tax=Candidiatus Paracoxiella cheracis TaxID=3405120 RepID=UPI003BF4A24F
MTILCGQRVVCPKNNPSPIHSSREQSAQTLKALWQDKEYRLFPRAVLRYLRHDQAITDAAKLCWQTLFEFAFFDSTWSITISKNELARELNKSPSTIARLLNQLEKSGYIKRHQRIEDNAWQASCIDVRLPQAAIAQLSSSPDRKKSTESTHNLTGPSNTNDPKNNHPDALSEDGSISINEYNYQTKSTEEVLFDVSLTSTKNATTESEGGTPINRVPVNDSPKTTSTQHQNRALCPSPNMKPGLSTNETRKNNNKFNKINTTTQSVVVNFITSTEEGDGKVFANTAKQIQEYQTQIEDLNAELQTSVSRDTKWGLLKQLATLEGALIDAKQQQATAKQHQAMVQTEKQRQVNLTTHRDFCQQLPGPRPISEFQLRRIEKSLQASTIPRSDHIRVLNEIVFEIRMGSLTHQRDTQNPLTTDHAINIALKLVREGRWQAPNSLVQNHHL